MFAFLLGGENNTSQSRGENPQTPPPYGIDLGTEHKTMLWKQQKALYFLKSCVY